MQNQEPIRVGVPSIDQLKVFLTVVEEGSFAAGGRKLHRAPSAVSYTIANLESQLGVVLFDRSQTRKPVLTLDGELVLAKARAVATRVDDLRASVKSVREGLESEVSVVVDGMLPSEWLVATVRAFEKQFPSVRLRLQVETLGAVAQTVQSGAAEIGVGGSLHSRREGLECVVIGEVSMIPVAAPEHPLARGDPSLPGRARQHRQLVLTVRSTFSEGPDFGVFAPETWYVTDLSVKHAMLLGGLGWGNMPEPMVRADLASGRLVQLSLPEVGRGTYALQAMFRTGTPPGPAGSWLFQNFLSPP